MLASNDSALFTLNVSEVFSLVSPHLSVSFGQGCISPFFLDLQTMYVEAYACFFPYVEAYACFLLLLFYLLPSSLSEV